MFAGGRAPGAGGAPAGPTYQDIYKQLAQSGARGGVRSQDYMKLVSALGVKPETAGGKSVPIELIRNAIKRFEQAGGAAAAAMAALSKII